MITRDEIVSSLTGAWEIFLDRADAMTRFDVSVDGFWRSFQAILLVIPSYFVTMLGERAILANMATETSQMPAEDPAFFLSRMVALLLYWVALPLILALVAKPFDFADRYAAYVVARNWSAVLIVIPDAVVAVLFGMGLFGTTLAGFLSLAVLIFALRFMYMVARHSLEVPPAFAVALTAFDFVLSLTIALTISAAFGA